MSKNNNHNLMEKVKKDVSRQEKAERERSTLLAQTVYLGTIGIMISLPIVIGAYLGQWLDSRLEGYSVSWTSSLIILGVFIGGLNVYLFLKEGE